MESLGPLLLPFRVRQQCSESGRPTMALDCRIRPHPEFQRTWRNGLCENISSRHIDASGQPDITVLYNGYIGKQSNLLSGAQDWPSRPVLPK
jgi:hypothetical protein